MFRIDNKPPSDTIAAESSRNSMRFEPDIFDDKGVLLLRAGSVITSRFLERLYRCGIHRLRCSAGHADSLGAIEQVPSVRTLDDMITGNDVRDDILPRGLNANPWSLLDPPNLRRELSVSQEHVVGTVDQYADLANTVIAGQLVDAKFERELLNHS